jgi:heat shock protein HslJ/chaperonin cofactor prefoldin
MNKRQLVAGVLSASLLAAALPGLAWAQDEETYAAEDMVWVLSSYADAGSMTAVPVGVETTLLMSGGEAGGSAGCNNYFGSYEIGADSLTFGEFGSTRMICEEPTQGLEDAYLALLGGVAGWAVDGTILSLSDTTGAVTLVFGDPLVEVTESDVAALAAELESLQSQIDEATAEVAALTEAAASVNVKKITNRIGANEDSISALEKKTKGLNVDNLKKRISANEAAIADLNKQMSNVKKRVKDLEAVAKDHEARISAIEDQVPIPEPA